MPTIFRAPHQNKKVKILKISGGTGGRGGSGGISGGSGGLGEGPRVKIAARTVTNINKNYSAATNVPSGFRTIPLCDIDLQREIRLDDISGLISLRRLHSAKIEGSDATRTVAVYQGNDAEQQWRRDIKEYMAFRHPNIVQLYGVASFGNIHAAVFHDDLIPYQRFLDIHKHSHFSTVYINAYLDSEFQTLYEYFSSASPENSWGRSYTFYIRCSTGRFCADLVPGDLRLLTFHKFNTQQGLGFLARENSEATIIGSLTLDYYHSVCYWDFSVVRSMSISTSRSVNIPSVFNCASADGCDDMLEIAWLPTAEFRPHRWCCRFCDFMPNGWTRFNSDDIAKTMAWLIVETVDSKLWLSQANHIFTALQISFNLHDYVVVNRIDFRLEILAVNIERPMPTGFLFLCPPEYLQIGKATFRWPDLPAYWSLDPSGTERLTLEEAVNLGFPPASTLYESLGQVMGCQCLCWTSASSPQNMETKFPADGVTASASSPENMGEVSVSNTFEEIADSTRTDPDLVTASTEQDVEEVSVSSTFEDIVNSTRTDREVPIDTVDAEMPLSNTFKFILTVQLSLLFFLALSWVLFEI
ncbi:hypothetical protein MSAN_00300700 [Mycena sanguinolenta]|uniref:Uncharacterized protein n=1 Tax=Mycena sanguinolenta TaxID=230812 RepID=A0A8H7DJ49_9AGAR|nr:hypothetical protein MSAN_00300700 [Mycena sanguinolenta]